MESFKEVESSIIKDDIINIYENADLSKVLSYALLEYAKTRKPVAFQELFIPLVEFIRGRFQSSAESAPCPAYNTSLLMDKALLSLEFSLLDILSVVSSKVLEMEFSLYRMRYQSALDRFLSNNVSTALYSSFIKNLYEGYFLKLLEEYPGMLELFTVVTNQWLSTTAELITRLKTDIGVIRQVFNSGLEPGKVTEITMGISDRHNGGRTAAIVSFDSGLKLVYKPRTLGMEEAWFNLLQHINLGFAQDLFKGVKVLNKDTYGWMEYVEHLPCRDEKEIRQYYRRAGAILSMVHLLRGTDCHYQNLIAHGSYPVLIDLETLFHPYSREMNINTQEYSEVDMENYYSVLRTGLLPGKGYVQDGNVFDLSGFGGGSAGYPKIYQWVDVNTDSMRQAYADREEKVPANIPCIGDKFFLARNYVEEIITGFEKVYMYAMSEKPILLRSKFFQAFAAQKSRVVLRPTVYYFDLLSKSIEPKYLRVGITESDFEEVKNYPLSFKEFKCIKGYDIPYFYMDVVGRELELFEEQAGAVRFSKSGFDYVKEYLMVMQSKDLQKQITLIYEKFK